MELADAFEKIGHENQADHAADAEIILCCANSGLAAKFWPGKGIDHTRFVQLLIYFSSHKFMAENISVLLLIKKFDEKSQFYRCK